MHCANAIVTVSRQWQARGASNGEHEPVGDNERVFTRS
eukprot:SAG11_NODE_25699_length_355_cov_0.804688_1_plen_37_part_01